MADKKNLLYMQYANNFNIITDGGVIIELNVIYLPLLQVLLQSLSWLLH